jgi:HEXXH motif-containing protein
MGGMRAPSEVIRMESPLVAETDVPDTRDALDDEVASLSTPHGVRTQESLGLLAAEAFAAVVETVLARCEDTCARSGENVVAALDAALAQSSSDFETAWAPGLGYVTEAIQRRDEALVQNGIIALLLNAASRGAQSEWRVECNKDIHVYVGDLVLPPASSFEVRRTAHDSTTLRLAGRDGAVTIDLWPRLASTDGDSSVRRLMSVQASSVPIRLWPHGRTMWGVSTGSKDSVAIADDEFAALRDALQNGIGLLAQAAPLYYEWVSSVLRRIIVKKRPRHDHGSGSFGQDLGVCECAVSEFHAPIELADTLVHEASHQYFNLVSFVGPAVEPGHDKLYYSPFKGVGRPLDRILVAYHAFANVSLLFQQCAAAGVSTPDSDSVERDVAVAERTLDGARDHLTAIGTALFEPLFQRRSRGWSDALRM